MNVWKLVDKIKTGLVAYSPGDELVLIRRKSNGYPNSIKEDERWFLKKVDNEYLIIAKRASDGIGWIQEKRIHRTYFIPKYYLRHLKIEELLKTND
jgi:hypothetical protein